MVAATTQTRGQDVVVGAQGLAPVALGLAVIAVVFAISFFPSIKWMAGEWSSSSGVLSHGYLIVAISLALIVRAIPEVASIAAEPAWLFLPGVLGLSVVWLLGYVATVVAVQTVLLPIILLASVVTVFGLQASRPMAFPILFVYFAIPAWEHLQFIFQAITVTVVGFFVRFADIPALLEGNRVLLASGTFEVAGGCGGLAFVVSGLSLAVLYGHLFYTSARHKVLLVAVTLGVALLGNWIRVFAIIAIGYRSDMQNPLVDDHLTVGWIMFALLMIPVYWFATRLENDSHIAVDKHRDMRATTFSPSWAAIAVVAVAMATGPVWAKSIAANSNMDTDVQLQFPTGAGNWIGPLPSQWDWQPSFSGPDVEHVVRYENGDEFVLVYMNLYLIQEQDKELVYFNNRIGGGWQDSSLEQPPEAIVRLSSGQEYRQDSARNYLGNWLFWSRYQVGDTIESSDVRAKIQQAVNMLKGEPQSGAIAFATPCQGSCASAAERLEEFAEELGNDLRIGYSVDNQ